MKLLDLIDDFTWSSQSIAAQDLLNAYEGVLGDRFGAFLGGLFKEDPHASKLLISLYEQLSSDSFRRFLLAPETSHRLLWATQRERSDTSRYIRDALLAEAHRAGILASVEEECWTAAGDYVARPTARSNAVDRTPTSELPLDFDSPSARVVRTPWETNPLSPGAKLSISTRDGHLLNLVDRRRAHELLRDALEGIKATSLASHAFVVHFNLSVMVLRSPRLKFSSSSPEKFIGATILWMSQHSDEDCVDLADALIHEAVHSVLDMHEYLSGKAGKGSQPWFSDPLLYDGRDRTVSPWSSNPLALLTFVHACFVWFALVQFWTRATLAGWFPKDRCLERLAKAVGGFLHGQVSAQLQPFVGTMNAELVTCVRLMEQTIRDGFVGEGF